MGERPAALSAALRAALVLASTLCASVAAAHGRPAFVGALAFDPTDPQRVVARGTWGLAISDDGGATWRWSCAAAMGIDPTREDPALLVAPDGAILLGAFHGVVRSDPEGCAFGVLPETEGEYIIDLATDPLERPYAILTSGIDPDRLLRSDDRGASFAQVGEPIADILLERVVPAPSDATRVYMSGAVPRGADGLRHGYFLRSIDGAASFVAIEIPLEGEERNVHVLAVDPTDPDRIFARMVRRITDAVPERLILSEDGGDTWRTVMTAHAISSVAITPDGATVYAGSSLNEGVFRSDTGGRSFALAQGEITIYCLEIHDGALWACVDELIDGLSVGRSADGGASFETRLRLSEIRGMLPCSQCTPVGFVCPAWAPDVAFDLRLDGGGAGLPDGSITGLPRDAAPPESCEGFDGAVPSIDGGSAMDAGGGLVPGGGCGCRAGAPRRAPALAAGALALCALLRRRRGRGEFP